MNRAARILDRQPRVSDYERARIQNGVLAMERFASVYADLDFRNMEISVAHPRPAMLRICGVEVSVRPELLLQGQLRAEVASCHGMLKLYLAKDDALEGDRAACTGAIVHRYAMEHLPQNSTCHRRFCRVLDVFAGEMIEAPRATVRHFENIEAACEEIVAMWGRIVEN